MASAEITLDHPVEHDGVTYRTLTIRPPTLDDHRQALRKTYSKLGRGIAMIALVCGVPRDVIRQLEPIDQMKIEAFLLPHMGG